MVLLLLVRWRGAGWRLFPRFLSSSVAVAASSAVASPACLGLEASVVGWPGMRTIWRRVSVTPQRKERLVKPGPPSKPWPRRTLASPTAWPSPGGQHLGPLTQCAWVLRHGRQCHETYHSHRCQKSSCCANHCHCLFYNVKRHPRGHAWVPGYLSWHQVPWPYFWPYLLTSTAIRSPLALVVWRM